MHTWVDVLPLVSSAMFGNSVGFQCWILVSTAIPPATSNCSSAIFHGNRSRSFPKENPRPFSRPSFPFSLPLPFLFPFQSLKPQSLKPQPQKAPESSPPGFMDWTSNMSHLSKFWPWHLCYSWNEINEDRQSSWENHIIWQRMALQKLQKKQVFGASPPILRCRPGHPG